MNDSKRAGERIIKGGRKEGEQEDGHYEKSMWMWNMKPEF